MKNKAKIDYLKNTTKNKIIDIKAKRTPNPSNYKINLYAPNSPKISTPTVMVCQDLYTGQSSSFYKEDKLRILATNPEQFNIRPLSRVRTCTNDLGLVGVYLMGSVRGNSGYY